MKVHVHYYGQLRHLADREGETLELADDRELLRALRTASDGYDDGFSKVLFNGGEAICSSVMMLVNDKPVRGGTIPALRDGDSVSLIPAISGG